eukprot:3174316-Pyramimonas_sp.AAC.1
MPIGPQGALYSQQHLALSFAMLIDTTYDDNAAEDVGCNHECGIGLIRGMIMCILAIVRSLR